MQNQFVAPPGSRAVIYLRVSTGKQAKKDISLPDQRKQLRDHCKHHAYIVAGEYKDAKSGRDDKRPGFQAMLDDIKRGGLGCDLIIVHSYSRFYRDEVYSELHIRSLAKMGIRVISLTQKTDDSPEGQLTRRILGLFDEYSSNETSKHVTRSQAYNAQEGYWNGGVTPYGYKIIEVERKGKPNRKKLAIDEAEAADVRLMFNLALFGDGQSGPLGVVDLVSWLNERGYRTRRNNKWCTAVVHRILSKTTVAGEHVFNSKQDGGIKIPIPVPPIIERSRFDLLRRNMEAKDPRRMPPRVSTGEVLLTGLVTCPKCGGGMTTSTGKNGRYRYYACSKRMREGPTSCEGHRVPMGALDELVTDRLLSDLFSMTKINDLLQPMRHRQTRCKEDIAKRLADREAAVLEAKRSLDNLYSMVTTELVDPSDEDFRARFQQAKELFERAQKERDQVATEVAPEARATLARVSNFVSTMQVALSKQSVAAKRGYLRSFVDEIKVGNKSIQIRGRRSRVERAIASDEVTPSGVPTFVREWRGDRDSNPGNARTFNGFQDRRIRPLCHLPDLMAV